MTGGGYVLRAPATESEWAAYHRIRRTALFEPYHPEVAYDPEHPDERKPNYHPLIFEKDGVVIGTIRVDRIDRDRAAFRIIAIDPEHQRQGYGSVLLNMAEDFARRLSCRKVVLHGNPPNLGFYLRNGYAKVPWRDDVSLGDSIDLAKGL